MPPRAAPGPGRVQPSRGRGRGRGTPSDVASVATTSSAGGSSRGRGRGIASDVASVQSTISTPRGRGRGAAASATRGGAATTGECDSDHLQYFSLNLCMKYSFTLNDDTSQSLSL